MYYTIFKINDLSKFLSFVTLQFNLRITFDRSIGF